MTRWAALFVGVLMLFAVVRPVAAAPADALSRPVVEGWDIQTIPHAAIGACAASGPRDGGASLDLAAEGPQFLLIVVAPDFPKDKASYPVALSFDGKPPVYATGLGENGLMAIGMGRGEAAAMTVAASRVVVTVEGVSHTFSLRNAAAALDAVAHCAGQPTLAAAHQTPSAPIAGAGGWQLMVTLPGVTGRACSARNAGPQIDTMLVFNPVGDVLLIGGHSDWATWGGEVALELSIDDAPPIAMKAQTVNNLIMTLVKDPAVVARLRGAKTLDWTIPTGHVRGEVAGLGLALDAMKACKAQG